MAVFQSSRCRLTHRYREQAPSHILFVLCLEDWRRLRPMKLKTAMSHLLGRP